MNHYIIVLSLRPVIDADEVIEIIPENSEQNAPNKIAKTKVSVYETLEPFRTNEQCIPITEYMN